MVNVTDIQEFEKTEQINFENILKQIFEKQKELLIKYRDIEGMPEKVDVNNPAHQKLLKEFTFRGIEELAEAYEAYMEADTEHMYEEVSDAIHFFTEVLLMADIDHTQVNSIDNFRESSIENKRVLWKDLDMILWNITYRFSIACNKLKCKPWKQTQILTDIDKYKKLLIEAYNLFMLSLNDLGFSGKELLELYTNKHLVNKFRIRSNY